MLRIRGGASPHDGAGGLAQQQDSPFKVIAPPLNAAVNSGRGTLEMRTKRVKY